MYDPSVALKKLAERALAKAGELPLALLLELLAPLRRMRELAREYGLTPKGGFRIEKASAAVLAPLLAEQRDPERLDAVLRLLLPSKHAAAAETGDPTAGAGAGDDGAASSASSPANATAIAELKQLLALRDAELARARAELDRARSAAARGLEREAEAMKRGQQLERELLQAKRARDVHQQASAPAAIARDDKDLSRRMHDLEQERDAFAAADAALRRQLAFNQSRLRELEQEVQELEALLPKGKRRKKAAPPPPPPAEERRFLLPRFTAAFYKSLDGKEPRAIERAIQAVLLFCTEGHAYPGLEVKQLGGQNTWSLRASLGLRVYFRQLGDREIELLELGDREEQHTTLRRLKDR